jgi:regulator of sigma E protease
LIETPGVLWSILFFVLAISPLVFIHEMGHYLVGRWCGVKADVFSIGFGRAIAGWSDKRGTRWQVGWIPLGGYVRFAGDMSPVSEASDEWLALPVTERNQTFQSKAVWQRALIVLAGPVVNFLFAILVMAALFGFYGEPRTPPVVAGVQAGSAADKAGLRTGDRIIEVGGTSVSRFEDIGRVVAIRPLESLSVVGERAGQRFSVSIIPRVTVLKDRFGNEARIGRIGIAAGPQVIQRLGALEIPAAAVRFTVISVQTMAETLGQIITGRRSVDELGGPVKMAKYSGEQATLGLVGFILFMTMVSINLGFINLLPIPTLDGGHLMFYAAEAIRRKPLPLQAQEWAFRGGLALLLTFMVFVTANDLGLWARLGGLIG